jgi:hypothetical protein
VQDQSPNPFVSNIDQENQAMNHSDLKTIEFAAYIGLDWADQKHDICLQENHFHRVVTFTSQVGSSLIIFLKISIRASAIDSPL